jgi:DNA-binding CsgD family transcriptional regulator
MPEQMVRTNASSACGLRAGSVRSTPCRGAMVQYAVQRSVAMSCILSSRLRADGGGTRLWRAHVGGIAATTGHRSTSAEARAGRLDAHAAGAVIEAAGLRRPIRRRRPADLTDRQVEVLRLVSRRLSNAEIAERLVLSRRTVEHHVQDIYVKIGAARAGAAMFAMQHGLLDQSN